MGDGCIKGKREKNQYMRVMWSSEEQCLWLDNVFEFLSTGVSIDRTAEEAAQITEKSGINGDEYLADPKDFSDQYRISTRSHPFITSLTNKWYGDSGHEKKCWPDDIELSPTVLLLWYVGDGHYYNSGTTRYIEIALNNEEGNEEKINKYFERVGIPKPSRWHKSSSYRSQWRLEESKNLFEYMAQSPLMEDGPPDGFEYKFPEEYGGTGKSMSDVDCSAIEESTQRR